MKHLIRKEHKDATVDMSRLAMARLQYISLTATILCIIGAGFFLLRQPNTGIRAGSERPMSLLLAGLIISLCMVWVTWRSTWRPERKLTAGLLSLLLGCALVALFRHWLPYGPDDVLRGASPVTLLLLFFAIMVPVKPRPMLLASIAAVSLDPLALAATIAMGNPNPPWNLWLWLMLPNALVGVLAVITSRQLFQLNESIKKAREFGSYALEKELGAGGMGEVWLARHQALARPAAVKLIKPATLAAHDDAAAQSLLQRFIREAKATAQLQSPHTINVFDFGTAEDGSFYYVMELLEGMDLDDLVYHTGPLPPARAVHLLLQICHSLAEAHESGLYHRDIKPANIYICRQGLEDDFVKVLDFGIVKIESQEETKLTTEGRLMGSPAFLPPEQIKGQTITPSTDIYAFGCVAYWMLTGELVFPGDQIHAILVAHLMEAPEAPSARLIEPLPKALEELVLWCLKKSPEERPQSMKEVERILRSTGLAEQWSQSQARAWWEDHGAALAARNSAPNAAAQSTTLAAEPQDA